MRFWVFTSSVFSGFCCFGHSPVPLNSCFCVFQLMNFISRRVNPIQITLPLPELEFGTFKSSSLLPCSLTLIPLKYWILFCFVFAYTVFVSTPDILAFHLLCHLTSFFPFFRFCVRCQFLSEAFLESLSYIKCCCCKFQEYPVLSSSQYLTTFYNYSQRFFFSRYTADFLSIGSLTHWWNHGLCHIPSI